MPATSLRIDSRAVLATPQRPGEILPEVLTEDEYGSSFRNEFE